MDSQSQHRPAGPGEAALVAFLSDEKSFISVVCQPQQAFLRRLDDQQKDRFFLLIQLFSCDPVPAEITEKGNRGNDEPRKRKRPNTSSARNPWGALVSTESVSLNENHARFIRHYGDDGARFMNDELTLLDPYKHLREDDDEGTRLLLQVRFTMHLQSRQANDPVRWLFSMLFYYDLTQTRYPDSSGRVGHCMAEAIREVVNDRVPEPETLQLEDLGVWSLRGKKLDHFCRIFGTGSLFLLQDRLSKNFLDKLFTYTGEWHDLAINHLQNLGVTKLAEESGANALGQSIRAYMIRPYREACVKQTFASPLTE